MPKFRIAWRDMDPNDDEPIIINAQNWDDAFDKAVNEVIEISVSEVGPDDDDDDT